jgi:hypothetical protein
MGERVFVGRDFDQIVFQARSVHPFSSAQTTHRSSTEGDNKSGVNECCDQTAAI